MVLLVCAQLTHKNEYSIQDGITGPEDCKKPELIVILVAVPPAAPIPHPPLAPAGPVVVYVAIRDEQRPLEDVPTHKSWYRARC